MTKTLKCDSCGANLTIAGDSPNAKCEYCGSFVRLRRDSEEVYSSVNILAGMQLLGERVRDDNFDSAYKNVEELIKKNAFVEANRVLGDIIKRDHTQARAWYFKSLLPVLEQESVVFSGCYININIISKLTKREHIHRYLSACGLPRFKHGRFMRFYASVDFLYEQKLKFIDKAIEHASTDDRKEFMQKHKKTIIKRQKRKLRRRRVSTVFWILVLGAVVVGSYLLFRYVLIDKYMI